MLATGISLEQTRCLFSVSFGPTGSEFGSICVQFEVLNLLTYSTRLNSKVVVGKRYFYKTLAQQPFLKWHAGHENSFLRQGSYLTKLFTTLEPQKITSMCSWLAINSNRLFHNLRLRNPPIDICQPINWFWGSKTVKGSVGYPVNTRAKKCGLFSWLSPWPLYLQECSCLQIPDRPFHNFRASKSVDTWTLFS